MAASSARATAGRPGRRTRTAATTSTGGDAAAVALSALSPADWVVMHDVAWPGRSRARIDHVVVGPPGVFVIDSTTRPLTADRRGAGEQPVRAGSVRRAEAAADAIAGLLPAALADRVFPMLSLAGEGGPPRASGRVVTCSAASLRAALVDHGRVLAPERVAVVARGLRAQLPLETGRAPGARRGGRGRRDGVVARWTLLTSGAGARL